MLYRYKLGYHGEDTKELLKNEEWLAGSVAQREIACWACVRSRSSALKTEGSFMGKIGDNSWYSVSK